MIASSFFIVAAIVASVSAQSGSGSSATCNAAPKTYPNLTGEALYQQLLADLSVSEVEVNNVAKSNPNVPINNSSGLFLSGLLALNRDNLQLLGLANNADITGPACLQLATSLSNDIQLGLGHASDIIPGACDSLTGEAKYQFILQKLGAALTNLVQAGQAHQNDNYDSQPWLSNVVNLYKSMVRIQAVVTNNDSTSECQAAALQIATALTGILAANGSTLS
ncbi:uncharacterized protein LOC129602438 [Paramacrobiotus metropolitanus]|uniref:uncharacterized protein LOC129602438 n=1 Tax=Paramacrobiotus metropolitanus TaxID=2943436 RepID=UPI0024456C93|nr:uncharacterized protein LOC129602438 [Paramacrobiotus metropolitanus]